MAEESRKSELIADLARARRSATNNALELRRDVDVVQHLKTSMARHQWLWLGGAGCFGLLLVKLLGRKKTVPVKRKARVPEPEATVVKTGLLLTVMKITFDLLRPALTKWLTHRVTEYIATKSWTRGPR